jgi:hypothetical protein
MLRIYSFPKCYSYRMVSRKPDAICLHCGNTLDQCELEYGDFMNMNENNRINYKKNYKKSMMMYNEKMLQVHSISK